LRRKLSKSTLALTIFSLILLLSIAGLFVMGLIYHPTYFISAHKINYVPERVVLLENPDSYTLEAINNDYLVQFYSYDDTNFDEIFNEAYENFGNRFSYKPFHFEYNNSYYDIGLVVGDNFPPAGLGLSLLLGTIASIIAIIIISFYKITKYKVSKE